MGSDPSSQRRPSRGVNPYASQANPLAFNPGAARCSIQLASSSTLQDGFGQPVATWTPYYSCYAEIRQLSGQELYQGDEFSSAAHYRVRIRYPQDGAVVNVGDRVLFEAHVYVIQIINNVLMRNTVLELTCLEIDGSS